MSTLEPFESAMTLAQWTAATLRARGIDRICDWRMLEYWMQVELFRACQLGKAGAWEHFGDYEQPYFTRLPKARSNTKWIDLVLAHLHHDVPDRLLWLELKDLGRNPSLRTVKANSLGIGRDLAALWGIDRSATLSQWRKPPPLATDSGRLGDWQRLADRAETITWWVGQIVLIPKRHYETISDRYVEDLWLNEARVRIRAQMNEVWEPPTVASAETANFRVSALLMPLTH